MSAVRKPENPDVIPIRAVEPAPDEPPFMTEDQMFEPPFWGKNNHSEADLRMMWSRIWRCFKSAELCKGFVFYNKVHTLKVWTAAFQKLQQMKDGQFHYILYVKRIADRYEKEGTPAENAMREAEEMEKNLAEQAKRGMTKAEPSQVMLKYWAEKNKANSINDIPDDDPRILRIAKKLKGE